MSGGGLGLLDCGLEVRGEQCARGEVILLWRVSVAA